MHANHREEIEEVRAGDIAAAIGLRKTTTGDTLCDEKHPIVLEQITFPEPVISVAVEPKTKADQDKMGIALQKLAEEDPTFRVRTDEETGQTIISGMGELHLEIIVDRMLREFKVDANVGKPQVVLPRDDHRQGARHRSLRAPVRAATASTVTSSSRSSPTPARASSSSARSSAARSRREYIAPTGRGIADSLSNGVLAGYPVVDVKVTLVDGSYHDVDSSEQAFSIAGSMGFKDGVRKAKPVLLEPIMSVDVFMPEEFMGDVMGDLSGRRGRSSGWKVARPRRSFMPRCRWRRCSATRPTCAA